MKKAFTLIELVFILVVLGILASIAIPKLASIQDDALISSENAGINAMRTAIQAVHGKILLSGGTNDLNITVSKDDGTQESCAITSENITNGYPKYLNVNDGYKSLKSEQSSNDKTLAILLESNARKQWKTKLDGSGNTKIIGPATSTISDSGASLNTNGCWIYMPLTGAIVYKPSTAF